MQPSAFAVTLLGAPEVGKTALARNFCGDALQQEEEAAYRPTAIVTRHQGMGDGRRVDLWEVPSWELALDPGGHLRGRSAVVFVLDCSRPGGLDDDLTRWLQVARYHCAPDAPFLVVATKAEKKAAGASFLARELAAATGMPEEICAVGDSADPGFGRGVVERLLALAREASEAGGRRLGALEPVPALCLRPAGKERGLAPSGRDTPRAASPAAAGDAWEVTGEEVAEWRGRPTRRETTTRIATWNGENVAVKGVERRRLEGLFGGSPEAAQAEIARLVQLSNENLVRLLKTSPEGEDLLLISEYTPSGTLERYIRKRRPSPQQPWRAPWQQAYRWALEIGQALCYLHERSPEGLPHGNLRPSTVLLTDSLHAKLGVASILSPPQPVSQIGSLDDVIWIAPEVVVKSHRAGQYARESFTKSADTYSFALVVWFICTGLRPWAELDNDGEHLPHGHVLEKFLRGEAGLPKIDKIFPSLTQTSKRLFEDAVQQREEERPEVSKLVHELAKVHANAASSQCCSAS